jgi:hypothetical protein
MASKTTKFTKTALKKDCFLKDCCFLNKFCEGKPLIKKLVGAEGARLLREQRDRRDSRMAQCAEEWCILERKSTFILIATKFTKTAFKKTTSN